MRTARLGDVNRDNAHGDITKQLAGKQKHIRSSHWADAFKQSPTLQGAAPPPTHGSNRR